MSSSEIAELTGKEHRNVLADCDKINESYRKLGLAEISAGVYTHPNTGKQRHREYLLTKIQCIDLMTGYNTELRIKVNLRWEELETEKQQVKPLSTLDILELTIKGLRENRQELEEIRQDVRELKVRTQTNPAYFTVMGYASLHRVRVNLRQAALIGKRAAELCKMLGFPMDKTPDPRFGEVNMYPEEILFDVFERHLVKN